MKDGLRQVNIFDIIEHTQKVAALNVGLFRLNKAIDWEAFRPDLIESLDYKDQSKGGRRPWCPVLMLKILVLQKYYGLSDEQTELQIMDRLSFMEFLGLRPGDSVPDRTTIWRFKERLGPKGLKALFKRFEKALYGEGLVGKEGRLVDASFIEGPRQRNRPDQNKDIKKGKKPESFEENPHQARQKDTDARWSKKHDKVHYGYKNHVKVDAASKFILSYCVTDAAVHDSQMLPEIGCPFVCPSR